MDWNDGERQEACHIKCKNTSFWGSIVTLRECPHLKIKSKNLGGVLAFWHDMTSTCRVSVISMSCQCHGMPVPCQCHARSCQCHASVMPASYAMSTSCHRHVVDVNVMSMSMSSSCPRHVLVMATSCHAMSHPPQASNNTMTQNCPYCLKFTITSTFSLKHVE